MRALFRYCCVLAYLAFLFVGCRAVSDTYSAYQDCLKDPSCYAEIEKGKTLGEALGSTVSDVLPAPWSTVFVSVAGMLGAFWFGVRASQRKR